MKCVADAADDLEAAVIIDALEAEVLALARSQVARNDAKEALEIARANAIVGGQITGKNAEEREAAARMLTADLHVTLHEAENALVWARARAEIARAAFQAALMKPAHEG